MSEDVFDLFPGSGFDGRDDQERRRAVLLNGVAQAMGSREGRALLRWIVDQSHAMSTAYSADSGAMYYMQGQRSVGFALLALVREQAEENIGTLITEEK